MRRIAVLGATGSIGESTLDVIARHPDRYQAAVLSANKSVEDMATLCRSHRPQYAVMGDEAAADALKAALENVPEVTVAAGAAVLDELVSAPDIDTVVAGIVGFAGLRPTLSAARSGKTILLANKEALVSAGGLFMEAVKQGSATLLPVDSEHNAMHQCLPIDPSGRPEMSNVEKIVLTASGGPFRGRSRQSLDKVTPEEACAHPNWSMGQKISVDSATLANKGLELAEACWLFHRTPDEIDIVVHPQSIVHSMVYYRDGSVLAQLANPDMRVPIAYGLAFPDRMTSGAEALDLTRQPALEFSKPDVDRFPCVSLGRAALEAGGTAPAVLNAANEIAVAAFLSNRLGFQQIPAIIEAVLSKTPCEPAVSLDIIQGADSAARIAAKELI